MKIGKWLRLVVCIVLFGVSLLSSAPAKAQTGTITLYSISTDGYVGVASGGVSWSNLVSSQGNQYLANGTNFGCYLHSGSVANTWQYLYRGIVAFDASSSGLPANAVANSATLYLYGDAKADNLGVNLNINIYSAGSDFQSIGNIPFSSPISFANFSITGYNSFALNSNGLAAVSLTGISRFGTRNENYDAANVTPSWQVNKNSYIYVKSYEQGELYRPKLVINYTIPDSPPSNPPPTYTLNGTAPIGSGTPDYVIYQDAVGFRALRTYDNTILFTHTTDAAAVTNSLLQSIALISNTVPRNYRTFTNLNGWKLGTKIEITCNFVMQSPLIIPPNSGLIMDFRNVVMIVTRSMTDVINIDSTMNSKFHFGIICVGAEPSYPSNIQVANMIHLQPRTPGQDGIGVLVTRAEINTECLIGNITNAGIFIDPSSANLTTSFMDIRVREASFPGMTAPVIKCGTGGAIVGSKFAVDSITGQGNNLAGSFLSIDGVNTKSNIFNLNLVPQFSTNAVPPIGVDNSNWGNTIVTQR